MKIEHLAIWVSDLEGMTDFYEMYFGAKRGDKYKNPKKKFQSYFLKFDSGCRLELMNRPTIVDLGSNQKDETLGIIHFAVSIGSEASVDHLTERLRNDGYKVIGEPRWTGDGYYESVILDPEGNRVEITV